MKRFFVSLLRSVLFIHLLFFCCNATAQVKTNFTNTALISAQGYFEKTYKDPVNLTLPAKNISELLETEKRNQAGSDAKPFQLAVPITVDIDIAKDANWVYDNEYAYGKYTLKLTGALSASINFDRFYLPTGTELYIYNEKGNMITGPVTENENSPKAIWGSWVYSGEMLTVEVKIPRPLKDMLLLHSNNVAYGYKELYKSIKTGGFGHAGACNINVICPLGNGWEGERNSVALILNASGSFLCTGSLVMSTCGTNEPYFLTANHCFDGNSDGWRFNFQAYSATCPNPGNNESGITYNGSTFKARNASSDFCLVKLNTVPPANSGFHYNGWTRSITPAQNATGIHHPSGDVMKISRGNNPVVIDSYGTSINTHWRVDWSPQDNGAGQTVTPITEPGSSGSPLFDQNHRIIGQLHGGPSACNATDLWDYYGRFDLSWTGGGTNDTRLSNWLDPAGTNAITANTTDISSLLSPGIPVSITIQGSTIFCQGGSVLLTANGGSTYTWQKNGLPINGATAQSYTATTSGSYTVTVNGSLCNNISAPVLVTVNPLPVAGITAAGPTSFCEGGNVVLTASAGNSWLWSNGATTQSITAGISGNYSVTVTNASGCSATSSPTVVTLNPNPQVSITASPYTKLFPGLTTILTANVMVPGTYLYTWFKDGIVINGAVTTALTLTGSDNPGSYTMTVTNTVGPHCSKTSSALLISDSATTKLFIYPSPNTGRFRVVYYTPGINAVNQILVYDSGGELVYDHSYMINSPYESMDVDIQQHAGGIYHVVLFDGLGKKIAAGSVAVQ